MMGYRSSSDSGCSSPKVGCGLAAAVQAQGCAVAPHTPDGEERAEQPLLGEVGWPRDFVDPRITVLGDLGRSNT
jgi:hypothetical protein